MPRVQRLDEVSCAICMDTLFDLKDDLDELMPIATPDCGHVFHEKCLLEWFRSQSLQYLEAARDQGLRIRGTSPSLSDAPAECPTCRAECFADPETGEPMVHRLFINFGDDEGSSNQAGSSPARLGPQRTGGKRKEMEVLGLARRARNLGEEAKGMSAETQEEDMEGMIKRSEGLRDDVVSRYVGGLTAALNNLRSSLETHPLIPTLNDRIRKVQHENMDMQRQVLNYANTVLPQEIQQAVKAEQARGERRVRKVQEECGIIKRELEKEQVARKAVKKAMEERLSDAERKMADIQRAYDQERADREALQATLHERNKLLKVYQLKAASRKALRAQVEELQTENARLNSEIVRQSFAPPFRTAPAGQAASTQGSTWPMDDIELDDEGEQTSLSIEEISPETFTASQKSRNLPPYRNADASHDDSLEIDMPSFADQSLRAAQRKRGEVPGPSRLRHPTARTYSSEQFSASSSSVKKRPTSSKYFADENDATAGVVLIDPSSSPERSVSPVKRSRTNPFTSSREVTERRKHLAISNTVVMDLSTPDRQNRATPLSNSGNNVDNVGSSTLGEHGKGMVDWLGVRDMTGRPKKGVVAGVRVKRRA